MDSTYRDSHTKDGKAVEYDSHFRFSHRAFLWSQERGILSRIQRAYLGDREYDYLDFACGTGRILAYMEGFSRTSTGVDVSPEMLRECRGRVSSSTVVEADVTRDRPFAGRHFDLITTFRFFLNAEESLRQEVIMKLGELLAADGYLVFNNHMNRYSLIAIALRVYGVFRRRVIRTWTLKEIAALVKQADLEVVAVYHTGVIPGFEHIMLLPRRISAALESFFSRIGFLRHVAQIQIVVCRHKSASVSGC